MKRDLDKTKAVIAYIIDYFQRNDLLKYLGKVKLVKILWYADREFMYKYFKPITNLEYRKMPQGPLPSNFDSILKSMEEEDIIKSYKIDKLGGYTQHSFFCLKEPNLDDFTSQEINVLDKVIAQTYKKTAQQLSSQTHDELWESIGLGKVMPLESVFLQDVIPATIEDVDGSNQHT